MRFDHLRLDALRLDFLYYRVRQFSHRYYQVRRFGGLVLLINFLTSRVDTSGSELLALERSFTAVESHPLRKQRLGRTRTVEINQKETRRKMSKVRCAKEA